MSCFIVSQNHLRALLTFANAHNVCAWNSDGVEVMHGSDLTSLDCAMMTLHVWNVKAWNTRYREHETPAPFCRFKCYAGELSPVQILRACNCYDYQACEAPDYESSDARAIIAAIRARAISALPGYRAADWEIK